LTGVTDPEEVIVYDISAGEIIGRFAASLFSTRLGRQFMKYLLIAIMFWSAPTISATGDELYSVNSTGWLRKDAQTGEVLNCSVCEKNVQFQISVGPQMPASSPIYTNAQFASKFAKESEQRAFAESILKDSIPTRGINISVNRIGIVPIDGLQVIQFSAVVDMLPVATRDTTFITVHKGRILKFTANYYDGDLTPKASDALSKLISSIRFVK